MPARGQSAVESGPDSILLTRIVDGDERALGVLYDRLAPTLYALALRITRDADAAGGILEEVFAHLWDEREHHRGGSSPTSIATRLLRDGRARALASAGQGSRIAVRDPVEGDADPIPAALMRLDRHARQRVAAFAVAQLGPLGRRALELMYFQDLPVESIARRLNVHAAIVPGLLRDTQAELRDRLAAALSAPGIPS